MIASRLGIFMLWLIHWLPLALQARIGNALGALLYQVASKRRKIGAINLALCFPEWSQAQRDTVLHRHFQAMTRAAIEHGGLDSIEAVTAAVESTGAIAYTARVARQEADKATHQLQGLSPSPYKDALHALAEFSVTRNY